MAHGKETPRQKMIGMMYLVLTALLALNVSAEVLNAFVLVDKSLGKTTVNFQKKNEDVYQKFEAAYNDPNQKSKIEPWKKKADEVKKLANDFSDYVLSIKKEIVLKADKTTDLYFKDGKTHTENIKAKDDNNVPGEIMVLKKRGEELKAKVEEFRSKLISYIDTTKKENAGFKGTVRGILSAFNTDDVQGQDGKVPWQTANFEHLPLVAVITMLSKLQTDVRNAESDIINYLAQAVEATSYKFNKVEAIVSSPTNYVLRGQKYEAQVFIAASDSTTEPKVMVGGQKLRVEKGKGIYTGGTGSVGFQKWGGYIEIENPKTGEVKQVPFNSEYQVGEPAVSVSPTKMNVFYIGVDNPVDISATGVASDKLSVSISNGTITKSNANSYVVRVKQVGDVSINISAEIDGARRDMGAKKFRVKTVPDPIAKVAGKKEGVIAKNNLLAAGFVEAVLENFDFDLKFTVTKFTVSATIKGYEEEQTSNSNRITQQQIELIKSVASGKKLYFENIKATGPDGSVRNLPAINFKIQ